PTRTRLQSPAGSGLNRSGSSAGIAGISPVRANAPARTIPDPFTASEAPHMTAATHVLSLACVVLGQADWTERFPPHRIVGNVFYVGSKDLASYLVTTPEGTSSSTLGSRRPSR